MKSTTPFSHIAITAAIILLSLLLLSFVPYPLDGYEHSGIRRLERTRQISEGTRAGRKPPSGALKSINNIELTLLDEARPVDAGLPEIDAALQQRISKLFAGKDPNYSLALLDITPDRPHRLVLHKSGARYQPGSLGKLAIIAGLFSELARLYPDDHEARLNVLKSRMVTAGPWVLTNHHTIPIFNPETGASVSRAVIESDVFSLFEWADHTISASSNAAASVLWKEVVLMRAFGENYPPSPEQEREYFTTTPKSKLGEIAIEVVNNPLREIGIDEEAWRLGSLFTRYGSNAIPAPGGSWGNTQAFLTYLLRVEEGNVVDPWSSLEIKRLMYQTERRIRYAASPELAEAAVYFKSGSLYKCQEEADYTCEQYKGNVYNYMNSAATIETADGRVYIVALMSNVLRANSASEHMSLASQIEKIMREEG